jgi:hypothetical protein
MRVRRHTIMHQSESKHRSGLVIMRTHGSPKTCLGVVQEYRQSRCTKGDAMGRLFTLVNDERGRVRPELVEHVLGALAVYYDMLNDSDRERDQAARDGAQQQQDQGAEHEQQRGSVIPDIEITTGQKRPRDGEADQGRTVQKTMDLSLLRFKKKDEPAVLREDVALTLKLQANYACDPAYVRNEILIHPGRPDFPTALWGDVVANAYVDLDKVFDSHFGQFQLVSDFTKVERHVRNSTDWTVAWARYQDAVVFLYPHRADELSTYARFIHNTFIGRAGAPEQVILYDKRVRTRIAECIRLKLTDTEAFASDFFQCVVTGTIFKSSSARGGNSTGPRDRASEICRKYNLGLCGDSGRCRFQHACLKCKKKGHRSAVCSETSADGGQGPSTQRK